MLLGLYPIAELTRVIVVSGNYYFPQMHGEFAGEIVFMWTFYLCIVPTFLFFTSKRVSRWTSQNREVKIEKM
jgi:hypothetical protein